MTPTNIPSSDARPLRWLMISLAFLATVINYLDRQTLSVAAPVLLEHFHMNSVDYSRVLFCFLLAYTIMNGVSGTVIDRVGTQAGYALCMAWWSLSSILHVFSQGTLSLGIFRFLLGMGEAGNWPAGVKVVAEWFPEHERALASGLFNSGSTIGAILAPPIVAFILLHLGWPAAFLIIGTLGLLWLLPWLAIYRTPSSISSRPAPSDIGALQLLKLRFVWSFILSKIFLDPAWYFYVFWFPEYLKQVRKFDLVSIGKYAWVPFFIAGLGNIAGGLLPAFLLRRGMSLVACRKLSITFFTILMLAAIPVVLVSSPWLAIFCVSIAMAGYTAANVNMLAFTADAFPSRFVASVYGLASMGAGFGGMIFTLIAGWVIDHYSYTFVFIGFGCIPLICSLILWTLTGPLPKLAPPPLEYEPARLS